MHGMNATKREAREKEAKKKEEGSIFYKIIKS
jgi:hypothetical protein